MIKANRESLDLLASDMDIEGQIHEQERETGPSEMGRMPDALKESDPRAT